MLRDFQENKIVMNSEDVLQWATDCDRTPTPEEIHPRDEALHEKHLNLFAYMIKNQIKPACLTQGCTSVYAALQTIAYHSKDIILCPLVRTCKARLKACLKKIIVMFCDMSPEDMEKYIDQNLKGAS